MTHIFFLLTRGQVSHLHKLASDELWHFYGGDPLTVVEANPTTGSVLETTIGRELAVPFHSVKSGQWFGARAEGEWSLGESAPSQSCGTAGDMAATVPLEAPAHTRVGCAVGPAAACRNGAIGSLLEVVKPFCASDARHQCAPLRDSL